MIDSGYRGNIGVILTNFGASDLNINLGDKIAQIMFIKPAPVFFEEVSDFSDNTVRGSGGFGSTGQWLYFLAEKKWQLLKQNKLLILLLQPLKKRKIKLDYYLLSKKS